MNEQTAVEVHAAWRIEYRTDVTQTGSLTIPVAFMVEAAWESGARWLGVLFRPKLTPAESDLVNIETWPELANTVQLMSSLFDDAWKVERQLGSSKIATRYPCYSALTFAREPVEIELDQFDPKVCFLTLHQTLLNFTDRLEPTITAPILPFNAPIHPFNRPPQRPVSERTRGEGPKQLAA